MPPPSCLLALSLCWLSSSLVVHASLANFTVDTYTPTTFAKRLHRIPHYDKMFHRVNNTFDPENQPYLESLGMMGFPFYACAGITFLLFLARCCFKRCCDSRSRVNRSEKSACAILGVIVKLFVIVACVGGCVVWGFVSNAQVDAAVSDGTDSLDHLDAQRVDSLESAEGISTDVKGIGSHTNALLEPARALAAKGVQITGLEATIQTITSGTQTSSNEIDSITSDLDVVDVTDYTDEIRHYNKVRSITTLSLLGVMCVPFVLINIGSLCRSRMLLWNMAWMTVLVSLLAWILTATQSSACVGGADLCMDPTSFIKSQVVSSTDSHVTAEYVGYYLDCTASSVNPLTATLNEAQRELNTAKSSLDLQYQAVAAISPATIRTKDIAQEVETLLQGLEAMKWASSNVTKNIDDLNNKLMCLPWHKSYVSGINSLCGNGLTHLGYIVLSPLVIALLAIIAFFIARDFRRMFEKPDSLRDPLEESMLENTDYQPFETTGPRDSTRMVSSEETLLDDLSLASWEHKTGRTSK